MGQKMTSQKKVAFKSEFKAAKMFVENFNGLK